MSELAAPGHARRSQLVVVAALVPMAALGRPALGLVVGVSLALVVALAVWPRRGAVLGAGLGALALAGAASAPAAWWLVAAGALLVVASALMAAPSLRPLLLGSALLVATALMLVQRVLGAAGWDDEVLLARQLFQGALFGLAAAGSVASAFDASSASRSWRLILLGALLAVGAAVARGVPHGDAARLPAWAASELDHAEPSASGPVLARLQGLQAAGLRGAGFARVGALLWQNADLRALRWACSIGRREDALSQARPEVVRAGELTCAAVALSAERGADFVVREAGALPSRWAGPFARLAADMEASAGLLRAATESYSRAAHLGDPHAARDAVRMLIDLGRAQEAHRAAQSLGVRDDPRVVIWLAKYGFAPPPAVSAEVLRRAWNQLMTFDTAETAERRGFVPAKDPGTMLVVPHRVRPLLALTSSTRAPLAFEVDAPILPDAPVPARVSVSLLNRDGFRLSFMSAAGGSAGYACNGWAYDGDERFVALERAVCTGGWRQLDLTPGTAVEGRWSRLLIAGVLSLESIRLPEGEQ